MKKTISFILAFLMVLALGFLDIKPIDAKSVSLVKNGNFESGSKYWKEECEYSGGSTFLCPGSVVVNYISNPHSGKWGAYLGGITDKTDAITQKNIKLPANASKITLTYYYKFWSYDIDTDWAVVGVLDSSNRTVINSNFILPIQGDIYQWTKKTVNLTSFRGKTVDLNAMVYNDSTWSTTFLLDDISIVVDLDTTVPTGSIRINNTSTTTKPRVTLILPASDTGSGVGYMRFSNDGKKFGGWVSYKKVYYNWNLTNTHYGGNSKKGKKYVYVQYKDKAGNKSKTYKNYIYYK